MNEVSSKKGPNVVKKNVSSTVVKKSSRKSSPKTMVASMSGPSIVTGSKVRSRAKTRTTPSKSNVSDHGRQYNLMEKIIAKRIGEITAAFTTDASGEKLWFAYLNSLPANIRQRYNCHTCRRFIEKYGNIVTVMYDGKLRSPLWHDHDKSIPAFFRTGFRRMAAIVESSKIVSPFWSDDVNWGVHEAGGWSHIHGQNLHLHRVNAEAVMIVKREGYTMLIPALREYPQKIAKEALRIVEADVLSRGEKVLEIARFFARAHEFFRLKAMNLLWNLVVQAPDDFCHIKSTMIHTLLEDLQGQIPMDEIVRRWNAKMHPLHYQRPQAPPKVGNVIQANKIFAELEAANSLQRRQADLDDIPKTEILWSPKMNRNPKTVGEIFNIDRLVPPTSLHRPNQLPPKKITREKFMEKVLPRARTIEFLTGAADRPCPFFGFTTAVDRNAPYLFQWDHPFAWYFPHNGAIPRHWGLIPNRWIEVLAIVQHPAFWYYRDCKNFEPVDFFVLKGASDQRGRHGLCLFPEILKSKFNPIRSTIEAYSNTHELINRTWMQKAAGVAFIKDNNSELCFRVNSTEVWIIDRWE